MLEYFFHAIAEGSAQAYVGVGVIFTYFFIMMSAIIYRIKKGDHMHH